jgi:hypothetical protein
MAFAFWDSESNVLPDVCVDGLRSAVRLGGFRVTLLSYKDIQANLPEDVLVSSAQSFLEVSVL